MAEYKFGAIAQTFYSFTVEALEEEAALDMARAYLDLQTKKYIRNKDIELVEASQSIQSIELVILEDESGSERDVTAKL